MTVALARLRGEFKQANSAVVSRILDAGHVLCFAAGELRHDGGKSEGFVRHEFWKTGWWSTAWLSGGRGSGFRLVSKRTEHLYVGRSENEAATFRILHNQTRLLSHIM
jgi:hypothetical protein